MCKFNNGEYGMRGVNSTTKPTPTVLAHFKTILL